MVLGCAALGLSGDAQWRMLGGSCGMEGRANDLHARQAPALQRARAGAAEPSTVWQWCSDVTALGLSVGSVPHQREDGTAETGRTRVVRDETTAIECQVCAQRRTRSTHRFVSGDASQGIAHGRGHAL
jgi:hypothetical protein